MQSSVEVITRIKEVISHWRKPDELASFAVARHGFGDSNGGFGVTYPEGADANQPEAEKDCVPQGSVEIYGYWGPPEGYEFRVSEKLYLSILASHLQALGLSDQARSVSVLADQLPNNSFKADA